MPVRHSSAQSFSVRSLLSPGATKWYPFGPLISRDIDRCTKLVAQLTTHPGYRKQRIASCSKSGTEKNLVMELVEITVERSRKVLPAVSARGWPRGTSVLSAHPSLAQFRVFAPLSAKCTITAWSVHCLNLPMSASKQRKAQIAASTGHSPVP